MKSLPMLQDLIVTWVQPPTLDDEDVGQGLINNITANNYEGVSRFGTDLVPNGERFNLLVDAEQFLSNLGPSAQPL
jgi:hypothetical protein